MFQGEQTSIAREKSSITSAVSSWLGPLRPGWTNNRSGWHCRLIPRYPVEAYLAYGSRAWALRAARSSHPQAFSLSQSPARLRHPPGALQPQRKSSTGRRAPSRSKPRHKVSRSARQSMIPSRTPALTPIDRQGYSSADHGRSRPTIGRLQISPAAPPIRLTRIGPICRQYRSPYANARQRGNIVRVHALRYSLLRQRARRLHRFPPYAVFPGEEPALPASSPRSNPRLLLPHRPSITASAVSRLKAGPQNHAERIRKCPKPQNSSRWRSHSR